VSETITFYLDSLKIYGAFFKKENLRPFLPYICKRAVITFTEKVKIKIFPVCWLSCEGFWPLTSLN
jgi:hypothetical protein